MGIFNKLKQSVLNQSDTYRLYECEYKKNKKLKKDLKKTKKRVKKLEKEFKKYKKANDLIIRSYNQQLNTIFLYTDFEAQNFLKYNHLLNIELLNFAVNICEKYGLQYWLEYGALLGAVRHKGFIPWDDDIDIGMMRKDYDKFLEVLPQELENTKLDERIKVQAEDRGGKGAGSASAQKRARCGAAYGYKPAACRKRGKQEKHSYQKRNARRKSIKAVRKVYRIYGAYHNKKQKRHTNI